ncbi:M20/M25/M40 family metallo-hydrolase [Candidatus Micrarchaeota archaeon]|nr:M20/M25/M40 family metallo-hydrolase [Candidatus Micrarchaeota archaeon]
MEPIELLSKIVSIDSVFPGEAELAHFLAAQLEGAGFAVELQEFQPGRYNVLAEKGEGRPVLLAGHMDTVPPHNYERDPLKLEEMDGKLYGLGAYDMKAGIAAIVKAAEKTARPVKIMFVSDEENESLGCYQAIKSGFLDNVEFVIVPEISDVHEMAGHTRTITLGRRGRSEYAIAVHGKGFHAAHLERGISAITEASAIAIEIEKMNSGLPSDPFMGRGDIFVRKISAESNSLSVPDSADMVVSRHLVSGETIESALDGLRKTMDSMHSAGLLRNQMKKPEVNIRKRDVPYLLPYLTKKEHPGVRRLASIIERKFGVPANYNAGMSVADENLIAMQGIPVISFGPIGDGEHSCSEWVSKNSYLELIDILQEFVA